MSGFGGGCAGCGTDEEPLGGAADAAPRAAAASDAQSVVAFARECGGFLTFIGEVALGCSELGLAGFAVDSEVVERLQIFGGNDGIGLGSWGTWQGWSGLGALRKERYEWNLESQEPFKCADFFFYLEEGTGYNLECAHPAGSTSGGQSVTDTVHPEKRWHGKLYRIKDGSGGKYAVDLSLRKP